MEDLSIDGVVPVYDKTAHTLTYKFPKIRTGLSKRFPLELNSLNGTTPNGAELGVAATFASSKLKVETPVAKTKVTSTTTTSITKRFAGIESHATAIIAKPGDLLKWRVNLTMIKPEVGLAYLKPGSEIVIEDTLGEHLEFVKAEMGGQPLSLQQDGKKLRLTLPASTIEEQAAGKDIFSKEFFVYTRVMDSVTGITPSDPYNPVVNVNNAVNFTATNISDQGLSGKSSATAIVKVGDAPTSNPAGTYWYGSHYGPIDGNGGHGGNGNRNPNPSVNDAASLTFYQSYFIDPFENTQTDESTGLPYTGWNDANVVKNGYRKVEMITELDSSKLVFDGIKMHEPISQYYRKIPNKVLPTKPLVVVTLRLADHTTKDVTLDWSDVSKLQGFKTFYRPYFGLKDSDVVTGYTITVTAANGGILSREMGFFSYMETKVVKGATGVASVTNDRRITLHDGTVISRKANNKQAVTGERDVTIVGPSTATPIVDAEVSFTKKNGNVLQTGDNRVRLEVMNLGSSPANLDGPVHGSILLPLGVTMKKDANASFLEKGGSGEVPITGKILEVIDDYNGSGQQLVRVEWDKDRLLKGRNLIYRESGAEQSPSGRLCNVEHADLCRQQRRRGQRRRGATGHGGYRRQRQQYAGTGLCAGELSPDCQSGFEDREAGHGTDRVERQGRRLLQRIYQSEEATDERCCGIRSAGLCA